MWLDKVIPSLEKIQSMSMPPHDLAAIHALAHESSQWIKNCEIQPLNIGSVDLSTWIDTEHQLAADQIAAPLKNNLSLLGNAYQQDLSTCISCPYRDLMIEQHRECSLFLGICANVRQTSSIGVWRPKNGIPWVSLKQWPQVLHLRGALLSFPHRSFKTMFPASIFP